jgi:hypothetical protein
MSWVVFTYSMSGPAASSPRVALWRRVRRLGAISPANGVFVLPARDECVEAFQWLAQEIRAAKYEALVMRVEQFEGIGDAELIARFNQARTDEFKQLDVQICRVEDKSDRARMSDSLEKLRRQYAEIARVDYFACAENTRVARHLALLAERLSPVRSISPEVPSAKLADYHAMTWERVRVLTWIVWPVLGSFADSSIRTPSFAIQIIPHAARSRSTWRPATLGIGAICVRLK